MFQNSHCDNPMTDTEKQKAHDETMRQLREEFATKAWPNIATELGHISSAMPVVHQAAWLGFLSGVKQKAVHETR